VASTQRLLSVSYYKITLDSAEVAVRKREGRTGGTDINKIPPIPEQIERERMFFSFFPFLTDLIGLKDFHMLIPYGTILFYSSISLRRGYSASFFILSTNYSVVSSQRAAGIF
jgi:hypothetical protein